MLQPRMLEQGITVSGQLDAADFAALAARGVRLVINNRPDNESPNQMNAAEGAWLAERARLAYRHVPVRFPTLSADDVDRFAAAMADADGPVHAHCASGVRSTVLWALAQVRGGAMSREQLAEWGARQRIDLSAAFSWLDRHHPG